MLLASEIGPRSSLERMLDTIRLRDDRPPGTPPALPARPTSRGRLPSLRRQVLNVQFKAGCVVPEQAGKDSMVINENKSVIPRPETMDSDMPELVSYEDADHVLNEIAEDDCGKHNPQGILLVQKHFRGRRARFDFEEMKRGVTTLQSFIRGERTRRGFNCLVKKRKAALLIQKYFKRWIAGKKFDDQRKDAILLQSVARGWLVRRRFMVLKDTQSPKARDGKVNKNLGEHLVEMKHKEREHVQIRPSVSIELRRRVLQVEAQLRYKEEENLTLKQQLQQYETRWSEYEKKMKSLEETWQTQLTALQTSLAAAKESLIADGMTRPRRHDPSSGHLCFDSEDSMSAETHSLDTPADHHIAEDQQAKQPRTPDARLLRNSSGRLNAVSNLVKEFEQRSRTFDDSAGLLVEAKSTTSDSMTNPNEELQKLKVRFDTWMKDYRVRLLETKETLQKHGNSEPKPRKRWWPPSCTR